MSLPSADDLFRPTAPGEVEQGQAAQDHDDASHASAPEARVRAVPDAPAPGRPRRPSGRVRHDEKMTVYVTSRELLDLEHARLLLRSEHGLVADRGRLVREAVALVLADFEEHGEDSLLVRRLSEE